MPASLVGTPVTDPEVQHAVLAMQSRQIIAVDDALHDPRVHREHVRQYNIHAVLAAPLIFRNRIIGVIVFHYHAGPHVFTGTEVRFAQQLATTAAIALDNARLFDDRLHAEQGLRASEQRLHLALDAAEMGMWDWDMLTDSVLWNEKHFSLFGVDPATFTNQVSEAFAAIHPDDRTRVQEEVLQAQAQQEPFYTEFRVIHPDESVHWIASKGQQVKGAPNDHLRMIGICFDITERKQSDQERERYLHQENIAQMHRLHIAGEFAALLAHQLNQPLSAIRSFAEAGLVRLRHGTEEPERTRQTLTDIVAQSERAAQSIRDLRQFLARQPQAMTVADLNAHVRTASGLMSILTRSYAIRLSFDLSKSLPMALMRPSQIEQVLINLMENAIDAIRHNPAMNAVVTDTLGDQMNGTIQIATLFDSECNELIVTVRDSGPGLDTGAAKMVFDPLYTTKKDGIGMGLTISRSIVEDHGGRIWAEAGPGGCFKFTLPVATP
jgi:PAS domain S-box-containing protein